MILIFNTVYPENEKIVEIVKSLEEPQSFCFPFRVVDNSTQIFQST